MKKVLLIFVLFTSILSLTGCEKGDNGEVVSNHNFVTVMVNKDGKIILDTKEITSIVTFVNYEIDGIIIQFIVVC